MRFVVRGDLGGYGAGVPALARLADVAVERPFVLLTGPNGSGKTALLRMARAAMGLMGERGGRAVSEEFARSPAPDKAGGDLGRLAGWVEPGFGEPRLARGLPGILDVAALGWAGQRSHLYDSRSDSAIASATGFGHDVGYHVGRVVGGRQASHGQFLRQGWDEAVSWGLGLEPASDAHDEPGGPAGPRAAFEAACPGGARPDERWLFLDEPETALDAERLVTRLCALLEAAAPGRLRVFCASHDPVFAAGLGAHPAVQVIDLGPGGDWYEVQRRALAIAADPKAAAELGRRVSADMARQAESWRKAEARAAAARVSKALKGLGEEPRALLDALYARDGHRGGADDGTEPFWGNRSWDALERRDLVQTSGGMRSRRGRLTELGIEAGRHRAARAAKAAGA